MYALIDKFRIRKMHFIMNRFRLLYTKVNTLKVNSSK